jgi:NADH dehydrogenase FAD-containing subunit
MNTFSRLVVLGSGWGGFELVRKMTEARMLDVTMVSPRNYFVFTPLLASTCVGTLEFRSVTEPIRKTLQRNQYIQASCESVDLSTKLLNCRPAFEETADATSLFTIPYDKLVISVGSVSNTFNIPGVHEHALFLKNIGDARRIRHRVLDCFERAMFPGLSSKEKESLLHFCIVGGGPTGIEFSAELHDLINEDLSRLFPQLMECVRITVYDVAKRILGGFDASLAEYAARKFSRQKIEVVTGMAVNSVTEDGLVLGNGEFVGARLIVWATGLAPSQLIANMEGVLKDAKSGRLLTDDHLRVLDQFGKPINDVYALGDCATIKDNDLPCTAQVAKQKAKYLRSLLSKPSPSNTLPFRYKYAGSMAYIGGWKAIVDLPLKETKVMIRPRGWIAWLFWRSAYFSMAVSWRNKVLIPMYWFLTWIFGRDTSKF